jgi:hypothetical protein
VLSVIFNATNVLISLTVISMAEDATMGVTQREVLAKIVVGVSIHFLNLITAVIAVVISMTTTTSVSTVTTVITTAAATTSTITAVTTASRVD